MNAETVNVKFADSLKSWNKGERLEVPLVLSRESREQIALFYEETGKNSDWIGPVKSFAEYEENQKAVRAWRECWGCGDSSWPPAAVEAPGAKSGCPSAWASRKSMCSFLLWRAESRGWYSLRVLPPIEEIFPCIEKRVLFQRKHPLCLICYRPARMT